MLEDEFKDIYDKLYPNGFDENLDINNYNITQNDAKCFDKIKHIIADSNKDKSIIEISTDVYRFIN